MVSFVFIDHILILLFNLCFFWLVIAIFLMFCITAYLFFVVSSFLFVNLVVFYVLIE